MSDYRAVFLETRSDLPMLPLQPAECFDDSSSLCGLVYDLTGREGLARTLDFLLTRPLTIALIVVLAFLLRRMVTRSLHRVVARAADTSVMSERRRQRADTMCSILTSIASFAIFSVALVMVLGELGLELAPIIASAGIVGVALGFGAQNLVKDFLAGVFMILEDQYGVGDDVDTGVATGIVESVGLRTTRLRAPDGVVWYVRNGEVLRIGNRSQANGSSVAAGTPVATVEANGGRRGRSGAEREGAERGGAERGGIGAEGGGAPARAPRRTPRRTAAGRSGAAGEATARRSTTDGTGTGGSAVPRSGQSGKRPS